jgi:hypothetical protein
MNVLCVFSDFQEDLPSGSKPAAFRLTGERVLMLWAPESHDQTDPGQMKSRLQEWEQRFKASGASDVLRLPVAGLRRAGVESWIQ